MTYLVASLTVILCAAVAGLASLLVGRVVSLEMRKRHHAVGAQVFQQLGVMFAVLLAFVFSEVWSQYNTAAQAINQECGALHGAAMLADALPDATGRPVNRAILVYGAAVIRKEWPTMANGKSSPEAVQNFRAIFDRAARLNPVEPGDVAIKSQILALLGQAHAARETRTFQLTFVVPLAMWIVLVTLELFLVAFVVLAGIETPGSLVFSTIFTGGTVMILVLVWMLDLPFEGGLALAPNDFVKMLREVTAMVASG